MQICITDSSYYDNLHVLRPLTALDILSVQVSVPLAPQNA